MATVLTAEDMAKVYMEMGGLGDRQLAVLAGWLERGDGVAVYQNQDLDHPELGHYQLVSYGSTVAQIETEEPPARMPDIGGAINWRYQLIGTYRGPS